MRILALDGSGSVAGVSVLTEEAVLAEYTVNYKKTHSQTLLPMLDEVMKMLESDVSCADYIAVTAGPGSFTGLRICASMAKGLGLALNKPLVPVPTTEALAYNLEGSDKIICPIMDARRNQVYTGVYTFEKSGIEGSGELTYEFKTVRGQEAAAIEDVIEKLNIIGRETVFLGDGITANRNRIEELMRVPYSFAPAHRRLQSAAAAGRCALRLIAEGKTCTAEELVPDYLRLSQAERERMERENAKCRP